MDSATISICGTPLRVQRSAANGAGICSKLIDIVRVLEVEKDVIVACLQRAALQPQMMDHEEMLDEASLLFVMMQFWPAQWADIAAEIKQCSNQLWCDKNTGSNVDDQDEDDQDDDDQDDDETPVRTVIKLKSRRLNSSAIQEERELEVTLPKSFSRQQFTKQYALRDYDMGATLQRDLNGLQEFWMRPFCAARHANPVGATTFAERRERIL